jgi:hypothetical protein
MTAHCRTPLSYQDWAKLGSDLKNLDREIRRIWCNPTFHGHLNKKDVEGMRQAEKGITKMRSDCENRMFHEISFRYKNDRDLLNVFYGEHDYPYPEPERKEGW